MWRVTVLRSLVGGQRVVIVRVVLRSALKLVGILVEEEEDGGDGARLRFRGAAILGQEGDD